MDIKKKTNNPTHTVFTTWQQWKSIKLVSSDFYENQVKWYPKASKNTGLAFCNISLYSALGSFLPQEL